MSLLDPQERAEAWIAELEDRLAPLGQSHRAVTLIIGNESWTYDRFAGPPQQLRRYQVLQPDRPIRKPKPNKGPQPRGHHWNR